MRNEGILVQFRYQPWNQIQIWGYQMGTMKKAIESGRDVLESLREQGFKRAMVWVDRKQIRLKRRQA